MVRTSQRHGRRRSIGRRPRTRRHQDRIGESMKATFIIVAVTLAACGSKSTPPPTKPESKLDPNAGSDIAKPEPTKPDPTKPVDKPEPAKPDPKKAIDDAVAAETAAYDKAKPV